MTDYLLAGLLTLVLASAFIGMLLLVAFCPKMFFALLGAGIGLVVLVNIFDICLFIVQDRHGR
jgi:hypothetical protein